MTEDVTYYKVRRPMARRRTVRRSVARTIGFAPSAWSKPPGVSGRT